jgi:transposase
MVNARSSADEVDRAKPPSPDSPFAKPVPKSLRSKSGRKPGGQPGHPGSTLALAGNPDERT